MLGNISVAKQYLNFDLWIYDSSDNLLLALSSQMESTVCSRFHSIVSVLLTYIFAFWNKVKFAIWSDILFFFHWVRSATACFHFHLHFISRHISIHTFLKHVSFIQSWTLILTIVWFDIITNFRLLWECHEGSVDFTLHTLHLKQTPDCNLPDHRKFSHPKQALRWLTIIF